MSSRPFLLLCVPVVLLIPVGAALGARSDVLNDRMRQFAGADAVDCGAGRSETSENKLLPSSLKRATQDACAVKAFRAKKPYFVRYDEIATDRDGETITLASAMNRNGEVKFFNYQWRANWPVNSTKIKRATRKGKNYWLASAICPKPVVYRNAVGCGTKKCVQFDQIDSAGCVIFTKSRDRLSPSE